LVQPPASTSSWPAKVYQSISDILRSKPRQSGYLLREMSEHVMKWVSGTFISFTPFRQMNIVVSGVSFYVAIFVPLAFSANDYHQGLPNLNVLPILLYCRKSLYLFLYVPYLVILEWCLGHCAHRQAIKDLGPELRHPCRSFRVFGHASDDSTFYTKIHLRPAITQIIVKILAELIYSSLRYNTFKQGRLSMYYISELY